MITKFSVSLICATLLWAPAYAQNASSTPLASIAAVVNGQVITQQDVNDRAHLLALSTGMPPTPQILSRLAPQVTKQLIDQTLELQEINKRKVVVAEADIVGAISHIEQGNNLPAGGLRAKLEASGVPYATLVNQIRTELGWQTVLHQVLGPGLQPTLGDLNAEKTALRAELGSTQYHIAEIFVPVTNPANDSSAKSFANTVIAQLRAGAPFPLIAAQFSQSQTALTGGDRGFVTLNQLDPAVASVIQQMPAGAISNPVRVPGGYEIVQLIASHAGGNSGQTVLSLRQIFAPFSPPIGAGGVGPAQQAVIQKLVLTAKAQHSCPEMEAANATLGNIRPSDPGPVILENVTPAAFQNILAHLQPNQTSQPLVAQDGVSIVMLCSKQNQAAGLPPDQNISDLIVQHRVELESQQLLDDLRNRSIITQSGTAS